MGGTDKNRPVKLCRKEKNETGGAGDCGRSPACAILQIGINQIFPKFEEDEGIGYDSKMDYSNTALNSFSDAGQVSNYAIIPMKWAVTKGIIGGTSPTTLAPKASSSRAIAAKILKNMIDTLM